VKVHEIFIARSHKAFIVHLISKVAKNCAIVCALIFVPFDSLFWSFVVGIVAGSTISSILFFVTRVQSDTFYLHNLGLSLRILIILSIAFQFTTFGTAALVSTPDYFPVVILLSVFLSDLLVNSFAGDISGNFINKPFRKSHPRINEYLAQNFQYGSGTQFSSIFYPFFKWLY